MNNEFENLVPGKLYKVLDIEGGEMDLTPISSTDQFDTFEVPRGSIVMFIEIVPPNTASCHGFLLEECNDCYYRIIFMYKSSIGYFWFGEDSGWHKELLTYEQQEL